MECELVFMGIEFGIIIVVFKRILMDCCVVMVDYLKMFEFGNFEMNFYI